MGTRRMQCFLVITGILLLFVTGCFKGQSHITLNSDGSADIQNTVLAAPETQDIVRAYTKSSGDIFADMKRELKAKGFTVKDCAEGDMSGIKATVHVSDATKMKKSSLGVHHKSGADFSALFGNAAKAIKVRKTWFYTSYKVSTHIDMRTPDNIPIGSTEKAMAAQMVDLSLVLSLPMKPTHANAPMVTDNGRTLTWPITLDKDTNISVELRIPNVRHIVITAVAGLVLLLGVGIVIGKSRRKPNKPHTEKDAKERAETTPLGA